MQLLLTSELSETENFWLRYLTDDLKSTEEANKILNNIKVTKRIIIINLC